MIIVIKKNTEEKQLDNLISFVKGLGLNTHLSRGENSTVLGLVGDTSVVDIDLIRSLDIVDAVKRIQEPYKNANRKFHEEDTVIKVGNVMIGGGNFCLIAGPCSVESEEQIITVAKSVKASGAQILRGGAFKPRTSPYSFQGLKGEGIKLLLKAKKETGLPVITEIMNVNHIDMFADVDIIQIGARNMQNFELLKEVGKTRKPVMIKRGLSSTLEELLMSAEYIMSEGNENVILCERGIRTFETSTRNTLDISAVPLLKEFSHLPVFVDPSHSGGMSKLVAPLSLASVAAGADGLIIEVHNDPTRALCDGPQALRMEQFEALAKRIKKVREAVN